MYFGKSISSCRNNSFHFFITDLKQRSTNVGQLDFVSCAGRKEKLRILSVEWRWEYSNSD